MVRIAVLGLSLIVVGRGREKLETGQASIFGHRLSRVIFCPPLAHEPSGVFPKLA
jgi:hypothetical protein